MIIIIIRDEETSDAPPAALYCAFGAAPVFEERDAIAAAVAIRAIVIELCYDFLEFRSSNGAPHSLTVCK